MADSKPNVNRAADAVVQDMTAGRYNRRYSGVTTDPIINSLTIFHQWFFDRLYCIVDDYGAFAANPQLIGCAAMPLQPGEWVHIPDALAELVRVGLVTTYQVNGQPFGLIVDYEAKQPAPRNGRRVHKFPAPILDLGNPGESGCDRGNYVPSSSSSSLSQSQSQSSSSPAIDDDDHPSDVESEEIVFQFDEDIKTKGTPAYRLFEKHKIPLDTIRYFYDSDPSGYCNHGPVIAERVADYLDSHPKDNPAGYAICIADNMRMTGNLPLGKSKSSTRKSDGLSTRRDKRGGRGAAAEGRPRRRVVEDEDPIEQVSTGHSRAKLLCYKTVDDPVTGNIDWLKSRVVVKDDEEPIEKAASKAAKKDDGFMDEHADD